MEVESSSARRQQDLPGVSVVIPALNEGHGIAHVIQGIRRVFAEHAIDYELIVVDDGSTDSTAAGALQEGATVISHPHNLGYGQSLKTGIRNASFDLIAITDADSTYPPDRLPDLIAAADRYDLVVGQRTGGVYRGGVIKRAGRFIFRWLSEFATGQRVPDINSGLRVFRRSDILPFFPSISSGFSFTTTTTLVYLLNNMFVTYVPIDYHPRTGRSKVRHIHDTLRALQIIVQAVLWYNPIKVFLLAALPFIASSVVFAILWAALRSSQSGMVAFQSACVSALILCLGFLAAAVAPVRRSQHQHRLKIMRPATSAVSTFEDANAASALQETEEQK